MPYTFELTFTGLCVFTSSAESKAEPKQVNLLFPDTSSHPPEHRHFPRFACLAEDIFTSPIPSEFILIPDPTGRQIAVRDISGSNFAVEILGRAPGKLKLSWMPGGGTLPPRPGAGQETWLDWITPAQRIFPHLGTPTTVMPYAGLEGSAVTSYVRLVEGDLFSEDFPRVTGTPTLRAWKFLDGTANPHIQSLPRYLKLHITGLDSVNHFVSITDLATDSQTLLQPKTPTRLSIQASLTNLLQDDSITADTTLVHFEMLKALTRWDVGTHATPRLPIPAEQGQTSTSTFCPPAKYT